MKVNLTKIELQDIRLALYIAIHWEQATLEAQQDIDWLNTGQSKRNIKAFRKLKSKLIEE